MVTQNFLAEYVMLTKRATFSEVLWTRTEARINLQVVIPTKFREKCLQYVHAILLSDHLGCMQTLRRQLEVTHWTEIH